MIICFNLKLLSKLLVLFRKSNPGPLNGQDSGLTSTTRNRLNAIQT